MFLQLLISLIFSIYANIGHVMNFSSNPQTWECIRSGGEDKRLKIQKF